MKKLLPSLRERKRYLVFEVLAKNEISRDELAKEITSASHSLYGDIGVSTISPKLLDFNGKSGILRCAQDRVNEARAILATVNNINGAPLTLRVVGISGTIKAAKEKFM
jgi:ribonuclease P/MRP protein subunit POP5